MTTVADLSLTSELKRVRDHNGIHPQKVSLSQMQALMESGTQAGAVNRLMKGLVAMINVIPARHIEPYNPVIGALSSLLNHREAKREMLSGLDENKRVVILEAIEKRNQKWSPGDLEWQLVQFVAMLGEGMPVDMTRTLSQQEFDHPHFQHAWDVLMELNMLRMEKKLGPDE